MGGRIDGWMGGWIDGWMDRWVGGWMDRWTDVYRLTELIRCCRYYHHRKSAAQKEQKTLDASAKVIITCDHMTVT